MKQSRLKKYKINQELIAKCFGYANRESFANSSSRKQIISGIEKLIQHIEYQLIDKLSE